MKPGDFVRSKLHLEGLNSTTPLCGLIVKPSYRSNTWGEIDYVWWWVLTEDGALVEELENRMELIEHDVRSSEGAM